MGSLESTKEKTQVVISRKVYDNSKIPRLSPKTCFKLKSNLYNYKYIYAHKKKTFEQL